MRDDPRRCGGGGGSMSATNERSAARQSWERIGSSLPPAGSWWGRLSGHRWPTPAAHRLDRAVAWPTTWLMRIRRCPGFSFWAVPRGFASWLNEQEKTGAASQQFKVWGAQKASVARAEFETTPSRRPPPALRGGQMAERDMLRHLFHLQPRLRTRRCATRPICWSARRSRR